MHPNSPSSARYTPWTRGVYEVVPALKPFGTDFGNGEWDRKVFQLDSESSRFIQAKRTALRERRGKYVRAWRLDREVQQAAIEFVTDRLASEYPQLFTTGREGDDVTLESEGRRWVLPTSRFETTCPSLDLLMRMVAEDMAIVRRADGADWIAYLHLCSPSHWAAEDKVGRGFFSTHKPIPDFEKVNAVSDSLVDSMIHRGPFVRFVWGVESDDRPNHHPEPPDGWDPVVWDGRNFEEGRFWVRTERQVVWGLPHVEAAIFTIRVGFVSSDTVLADPTLRDSLRRAVESMSPAALTYKGLAKGRDRLLEILTVAD